MHSHLAPSGARRVGAVGTAAAVLAVAMAVAAFGGADAAAPGYPLLPGLSTASGPNGGLIARGFDPIFARPRGSVVKYTYDNVNDNYNVYKEPESGKYFALPDQFTLENTPASEINTDIAVFSTWQDVANYYDHEESTGLNLFFFAFSESDGTGYAREVMQNKESTLYHASRLIVQYKMQMLGADVLKYFEKQPVGSMGSQADAAFVQEAATLPSSIKTDDDSVAVKSFIDKYGTHYVEEAFFGGQLDMDLRVDTSIIKSRGSSWAASQVSFGFDLVFVNFGFNQGYNSSAGALDEDFMKSSTLTIRAFGGDPALINKGSFDQWSGSVHLQPAPINATFRPIEALFLDEAKAGMYSAAVQEFIKVPPNAPTYCAEPPGKTVPLDTLHPKKVGAGAGRRLTLSWEALLKGAERIRARRAAEAAGAPAPVPPPAPVEEYSMPPPLPAVNSGIGRGFDGKKGTYMLPVAELGYTQAKTWYDPLADKTWSIPDELLFESIPCGCIRESTISMRNASDVYQSLSKYSGFNIGLDIPIPDTPVAVSLGVSFEQQVESARGESQNFSLALDMLTRNSPAYSLQFGASSNKLAPIFQKMLDALPSTQGPAYTQLIQYWGTHVVTGSQYGGACNFTTKWNQKALSSMSEEAKSRNIGISIGLKMISSGIGVDLGFGFGHATNDTKVDQQFADASTTEMSCVGGDAVLWKNGEWDQWVASVRNAPAAIPGTMQLRPISELVMDPTRRTLLREAIMTYLDMKPKA